MTLSGDLTSELKTRAQQDPDTFLKQELDNVGVKRVLLEGDPAQKIVEYAHSEESDLIMMPTHGYGPFRRLLLGSITSKVLHDNDCAVWTGVHSEGNPSGGPMVLGQILCAIDLGPHSAKTFGWADRLAAEFKSRLSIVHVVPSLEMASSVFVGPGSPSPWSFLFLLLLTWMSSFAILAFRKPHRLFLRTHQPLAFET
jgi:nucleotide-binding universal stress UspA family protein